MSENFFFACIPRFLRVQHSFAKGIKQNTRYRIVIFKGVQKCDQMKQSIKSKIVGGKIDLQSPQLFFNIPFYNPTKNVQFTIKLFEQKPNEDETEIGSIVIMSSDYIKSFKTENKVRHQVEGMLKDDLFCTFDLVVEKSKLGLIEALKSFNQPVEKVEKQAEDDIKSQSSASKQMIRQGESLISPSRRIQRRSGRQLKLRSRNGNRSEDEQSDAGSVTSQNKPLRKIIRSERQEKDLPSPRFTPAKSLYIERLKATKSSIVSSSLPMKSMEIDPLQQSLPTESIVVDDSLLPTFSNPMIESESKILKEPAIFSTIISKTNKTEFQQRNTEKEFDIAKKKGYLQDQISIQPDIQVDIKVEDEEQKVRNEDKKSEIVGKPIRLRQKLVKREMNEIAESQRIQWNSKVSQIRSSNTQAKPNEDKLQSSLKPKLYYSVFILLSAYLIYLAMTPTRRA